MTAHTAVTLCIVNHNGAEHLERLFRALSHQAWLFAEVLLIDNASSDSSLAVTQRLCPQARIIRLPENNGPGAARNAGFRQAANDLILFQDNDILLGVDTTKRLVRHLLEFSDALLAAPRVVYADDPTIVQYDSADCHFLGLMAPRNANQPVETLESNPCRTTSMVSACFLINRAHWSGEDLFDESFGFNLEDPDFGVRACLAGHALWIQPQAVVEHGSGTPGLSYRPGFTASDQRLYCLTLNRWIVVTKCFAARTVVLLAPLLLLFECMQFVWLARQGHTRIWLRATRAYWRERKRNYAMRQDIQRSRRVADIEILRTMPLPLTGVVRRGTVSNALVNTADRLMHLYWRLVRRWI